MRIIINGFFDNASFNQAFIKIVKEFNISKCYTFTFNSHITLIMQQVKDATCYDFYQTIMGDYADADWNKITPLDENIIYKMTDCEIIVLKMMDRLHIIPPIPLTYEERRRIYLRHLRYWNHIITKENIDLFLASGIPHEIYDFIIYKLCKLKNISTLLITQSAINGVCFVVEDFEKEPSQSLAITYKQIISQQPKEIFLSDRFRNHYISQISKEEDPVPWYMNSSPNTPLATKDSSVSFIKNSLQKFKKNPFIILSRLFNFSKLKSSLINKFIIKIQYVQKNQDRKQLFELYHSNTIEPDLNQKYIYIALHFQPECTTSPMAGAFVDQLLIVQMLAGLLPPNIHLYVKEHPCQTQYGRNISFYKDLLDIPQVRLIPRTYNSFRLLENCLAVATATGTAGWEGLFRQKSVLMFGHHFYQSAPAVFPIHSVEDCKMALHQIINLNIKPSLYEMEIFLKAMENNAVIAYADTAYSRVALISSEENTDNIFNALREKIIGLGLSSSL